MFNGTPSQRLKMNLQLFAEGDPTPTPEPTPAPEPTPEPGSPSPEPTPEPTPELPKLRVKFNHEEKELPYEEAVLYAQKGMNYDKLQERLQQLESNPALSWVDKQAKAYGLTTEQYIEAVNQQQEQQKLQQLLEQNIPEEYAKEMLDNRKFREQFETERQTKARQEQDQKDQIAFLEHFEKVNKRPFNSQIDQFPQEFWSEVQNGRKLKDVYNEYRTNTLESKLAELEQKIQTQQANTQNAQTSTGSLTGQGGVPTDFISKETFESNRSNQSWLSKNYDNLVKSMGKW